MTIKEKCPECGKKFADYDNMPERYMNRICKCGGIIRENGKPYWDILPSCSCQNPTMIENPPIITTTTTTNNETKL